MQVFLTDESRFCLQLNGCRIRLLRRPDERYQYATVHERDLFSGGSQMISRGFRNHQRNPLHANPTGVGHRDEIFNLLLVTSFERHWTRSHLAGRQCMTPQWAPSSCDRMSPAMHSPNRSTSEHIWDACGRNVQPNHPQLANLQQQFQFLQAEGTDSVV